MNPVKQLRYKMRIGLLLGGLLLLLILNSIASRESFDAIDRDAHAFYVDRLMPATFIYELKEHLDAEQRLLATGPLDPQGLREQAGHRAGMSALIGKYEQTKLTREERREWEQFRRRLDHYQSGVYSDYEGLVASLNHLSLIQAHEGRNLQASMSAIARDSALRSYLEIALIIAIGCVTLSLIGYSRNMFEKGPTHRPSLN